MTKYPRPSKRITLSLDSTTLNTLLKNETKRTEEINMKAIRYWIEYTVPEPPTEPHPTARIPSESFTHRIGLYSDVSSDTNSDTNVIESED